MRLDRQRTGDLQRLIHPVPADIQRTFAAGHLHPDAAFPVLDSQQPDLADCTRAGNMGAAAGAPVGSRERDNPHIAGQFLFAPVFHRGERFGVGPADFDWMIFPDIAVGAFLGLTECFDVQR